MTDMASEPASFDPTRWPLVFILLSMDLVLAFADLLALPIASPTGLRDVLRAEITRVRRRAGESPPADLVFSSDEVLDAIARTLGSSQRDALVWWAHRIFEVSPRDHLDLAGWSDVLRTCKDDPARWAQLALPNAVRDAARDSLDEALYPTAYYQRLSELRARPLSDWDLHMYAVQHFDDEDDILPTGPTRYLAPTVKAARGYAWWSWLLARLDGPAQHALWRSASEIVQQAPELRYIGTLPLPAQMEVRFGHGG